MTRVAREYFTGSAGVGLVRIVSGGQTGADRAALDWAIARGIPHGGWCPRGRRAEDGTIPDRYRLTETPSDSYVQRTEWNVRDSDGTVILGLAEMLTGGSRRTAELARQYGRPWLHLARDAPARDAGRELREFVQERGIRVLNVAGPRASTEPAVGEFVRAILDLAFPSARTGHESSARGRSAG
jgi:putative molybdenum carrier protein